MITGVTLMWVLAAASGLAPVDPDTREAPDDAEAVDVDVDDLFDTYLPPVVGGVVGAGAFAAHVGTTAVSVATLSISLSIADGPPIEAFIAMGSFVMAGGWSALSAMGVLVFVAWRVANAFRRDELSAPATYAALLGLVPAVVTFALWGAALAFTLVPPLVAPGALPLFTASVPLFIASAAVHSTVMPLALGADLGARALLGSSDAE